MHLNNRFQETDPAVTVKTAHWNRSGTKTEEETVVLREHVFEIYINDTLTMRLVCTPAALPELAVGRLKTEGIIQTAEDIDYLYICEQGLRAKVYLRPDVCAQQSTQQGMARGGTYISLTETCCTDNVVLRDDFVTAEAYPVMPEAVWEPAWVYRAAKTFFDADTPLHRRTSSTHSAFLIAGGEILCTAEDIGRHNALDKVIGYGLLNGISMEKCCVFTSGRVPVDVAKKALRAGIPVLISKERPTDDAVKLAQAHGLTIIGRAREDSFDVYGELT